jgi:hypothetical protein
MQVSGGVIVQCGLSQSRMRPCKHERRGRTLIFSRLAKAKGTVICSQYMLLTARLSHAHRGRMHGAKRACTRHEIPITGNMHAVCMVKAPRAACISAAGLCNLGLL